MNSYKKLKEIKEKPLTMTFYVSSKDLFNTLIDDRKWLINRVKQLTEALEKMLIISDKCIKDKSHMTAVTGYAIRSTIQQVLEEK